MFSTWGRTLLMLIGLAAAAALAACGDSGGGGGGNGSGFDNAKAQGTFTYALIANGTGPYAVQTVRGTLTFNGDGTGEFTTDDPSGPGGSLTYSVTSNNVITLNGFGMVGKLRAAGDFFAASDTLSDGSVGMMVAVKNTTGADASLLTGGYTSGVFKYDNSGGESSTAVYSLSFDGTANGTKTEISPTPGSLPGFSYTINYDGFLCIPTEDFGAVSATGDLAMTVDTTVYNFNTSLAIQNSTGKTVADLNGAYDVHLFKDDFGVLGTSRATVSFDGSGGGTFALTATSSGLLNSGPFTYGVIGDGTFMLDSGWFGMMSPDASVIAVVDTVKTGDGEVRVMVGVKQ